MAKPPAVFISYSWDSAAHCRWVESLALKLVEAGVSVALDRWGLRPGESLTAFMEHEVRRCGHVPVICTPNYAKRSNSRKGGVGYEQQLISAQIAEGVRRRKFIPIVREGEFKSGKGCAIPAHFAGTYALDMRTRAKRINNFGSLIDTIWRGKRAVAFKGLALKSDKVKRLANLELDGWELRSGVVAHERAPKTFYLPADRERRDVRVGDFVKLIFEISEMDGQESGGERMWVRVTGAVGPYLVGTLANRPLTYRTNLVFGTQVPFLAEHIIDIDRPQ